MRLFFYVQLAPHLGVVRGPIYDIAKLLQAFKVFVIGWQRVDVCKTHDTASAYFYRLRPALP